MNQKVERKVSEELSDRRKTSLKEFSHGNIRPHGKLWGMDVFSWANPQPNLVALTVESFPFPVIWIGNKEIFEYCEKNHPAVWVSVSNVIVYGSTSSFSGNFSQKNVVQTIGTSSISEAFQQLRQLKRKGAVVLVTMGDAEWERHQRTLNDFLELYQLR